MDHRVKCTICNSEYTYIIGTLAVTCNDEYEVTELILNGEHRIPANIRYDFRSQGNIHIIIACQNNRHIFIKSFDGHKGTTYIDSNNLMNSLALQLTVANKKERLQVDAKLVAHIQKFLESRAIKSKS